MISELVEMGGLVAVVVASFLCFLLLVFNSSILDSIQQSLIPNCPTLRDFVHPPFSAILIDELLIYMNISSCELSGRRIKLAVDVKISRTVSKTQLPLFDIVYYEENDNYLKFFDDVIRVIPKTHFTQHGNLSVPKDVPLFLEFWKRSKLINCLNINMSRPETKRHLPLEKSVQAMSSLMMYLTSFEMYPLLNGGTLLGWYRECSIIPHTKDIDFAVRIEEHKPNLLEDLQNNGTLFKLKRKFGKINDNYEFTLVPTDEKKILIDIFWLYSSQNESWVGGTGQDGSKYRYTYPRYEDICSAILMGHIFWITCSPEEVIRKEYGAEWLKDFPTGKFSWHSSHFNVKKVGKWSKEEMKEVYNIY